MQALEIFNKTNPAQRTNEPINAWLMNAPSINETECIGCIKAIVANRHAGHQQRDSTILEFMRMMLRLDAHTEYPHVTMVPSISWHGFPFHGMAGFRAWHSLSWHGRVQCMASHSLSWHGRVQGMAFFHFMAWQGSEHGIPVHGMAW